MEAQEFTRAEWVKIRKELNANPLRYGLPQRKYGSVIIGSFNIRKLGKLSAKPGDSGRDDATMQFLADVCRRFDLIAVQEVMSEMSGIRRLQGLLGEEYGLVVSDIVGAFPGEKGNEERLAYLYNRRLVKRSALVTEVTASRTKVIKTIALNHRAFYEKMENSVAAKKLRKYHEVDLPAFKKARAAGSRRKPPKEPAFNVNVDSFLQFIRTPFGVSFEVRSHLDLERYAFIAVNAHLHYGRLQDRRLEARTLIEWILGKVRTGEANNIVLMGDLNFDFDKPGADLKRILKQFDELGGFSRAAGKRVFVSFPFIFGHPRPKQDHPPNEVFRTNVRLTQTFDQIGIFSMDSRLGQRLETTPTGHSPQEQWGTEGGPDYGVFDFANLFARALNNGTSLNDLQKTKRAALIKRFEHKVSDHMPIWLRMPLPVKKSGFPTEA
jgi:endonuclease/exonuclease/phosphatase family metal-dependent hydrolase